MGMLLLLWWNVPSMRHLVCWFFFFQAEDGIRDVAVTGVQTCALPILGDSGTASSTKSAVRPPRRISRAILSMKATLAALRRPASSLEISFFSLAYQS